VRVSEHFNLGRTQPTLDFVDVDMVGDTVVFVDPGALRRLPSEWGEECVSLIQDFFHVVLNAIREGRHSDAQQLLCSLKEPNETHLGLSKGRARGRALGTTSASNVWSALRDSKAVQSGLLEDLEDTILMVEGISSDIVSDITTNIIREPLIRYTQDACSHYGISVDNDVDSGPLWDPGNRQWYSEFTRLPVTTAGKLLLVPKAIVRRRPDYDVDEYYRYYLLEYLAQLELSANSELVRLLKKGGRRVSKTDLERKYGRGKSVIVRETARNPEILQRYRSDKRHQRHPPLTHDQIAEVEGTEPPDWDRLLETLMAVQPGRSDSTDYERAVEQLLTALLYPALTNPQMQTEIHEGRKRIDISYTNVADSGFFKWLAQNYAAPYVFVECKNYTRKVGNPELDQLAGRFSPLRGQVGLLICRQFDDKLLFQKRCRDTAQDHRGFIVSLDDDDLRALVVARQSRECPDPTGGTDFEVLRQRFNHLIM
jgi:hypothetical protein